MKIFFRGEAVPSREKSNEVFVQNLFTQLHLTVLNIKKAVY